MQTDLHLLKPGMEVGTSFAELPTPPPLPLVRLPAQLGPSLRQFSSGSGPRGWVLLMLVRKTRPFRLPVYGIKRLKSSLPSLLGQAPARCRENTFRTRIPVGGSGPRRRDTREGSEAPEVAPDAGALDGRRCALIFLFQAFHHVVMSLSQTNVYMEGDRC